jgi:hypothetical protein
VAEEVDHQIERKQQYKLSPTNHQILEPTEEQTFLEIDISMDLNIDGVDKTCQKQEGTRRCN